MFFYVFMKLREKYMFFFIFMLKLVDKYFIINYINIGNYFIIGIFFFSFLFIIVVLLLLLFICMFLKENYSCNYLEFFC